MPSDQVSPASERRPWNKGLLIGQKRPLKPKDVWAIRIWLELGERRRDSALFDLAIDSKLRACDLVRLKIQDVYVGDHARERATIVQKKTNRPYSLRLLPRHGLRSAHGSIHVSVVRPTIFSRATQSSVPFVDATICAIGSQVNEGRRLRRSLYGTHSMRRTKAAQVYRKTGNPRAVQLLLGHTKLESTVRYLGIEVDDALSISEQVEI
jgi:integrase